VEWAAQKDLLLLLLLLLLDLYHPRHSALEMAAAASCWSGSS
jgi:hypothetical protein